jgi:hypothetical protein
MGISTVARKRPAGGFARLFTGGRYIAAAPIPPHFEVSQVKSLS